jgi:hypothetical protein
MRFFVLRHNPQITEASTDFLPVTPVRVGEAPRCSHCGRFTGGLPWLSPHRVEMVVWGPRAGDIAFGPGESLLISEKLKRLFDDGALRGASGFEAAEVARTTWKQKRKFLSNYYHVAPEHAGARIDLARSHVEWADGPICPLCLQGSILKRVRGVRIDSNSWLRGDIFYASGLPGTILVSQSFRDRIERDGLLNCDCVDSEALFSDFTPHASG